MTSSMKILIIGNPVSGDGKAARRIGRLVEVLTRRGHVVQAMLTQQAEDTQRFARAIQPGQFDRLVVAGGDGTLNGVLNGLRRPDLLPLVPLSSGTANLLARELHLPQDPAGLADVLEQGVFRRL
ncbi:MAG: diacylglycerol/lipid kinase family protein, partial [Planctomycetota bacterium]